MRATFLALCPLLLAACGSPPAEPSGAARATLHGAAEGWNVLLLSVDTVRADRLNSYGYAVRPTTPNIDALLRRGVRFERASAPRAMTWPSLATVLTGLYPSGHGLIDNGYEFADEVPTLPKILGERGYETSAFLSNMCSANHQGWSTFQCSQGRDGRTVEWASEWARQRAQGGAPARPFLLWVHLFGAHSPYYNGGDLARRELDPGYTGDLVPKKWRLDAVVAEQQELDGDDLRHLDAIYDAAVIGTDRHVGTLLAALEAAGALERTLIVFLADHGEELYQHNRYLYHACSVYEGTLHVPLAVIGEGLLPAAAEVGHAVELVDVTPTLLDLLGAAPPANQHGSSLRPYLERPDRGGAGKPAFSEYGDSRLHTALAGNWKLIDNPDKLTPVCFAHGPQDFYAIDEIELYDLAADPLEQHNLAAAHPAKVAELQSLIRGRFSGLSTQVRPQVLSEEMKQQLRSLGYVAN